MGYCLQCVSYGYIRHVSRNHSVMHYDDYTATMPQHCSLLLFPYTLLLNNALSGVANWFMEQSGSIGDDYVFRDAQWLRDRTLDSQSEGLGLRSFAED